MRLIDVDEVRGKFSKVLAYMGSDVDRILYNAPIIEAEPVRHGKYIPDDNYLGVGNCNLCGAILKITDNYCSNCGAKMRGDNDGQAD